MKNQPKTLKGYKNRHGTMKNQSGAIKTNLELYRVVMGGYRRLPVGSDHFCDTHTLHHNIYIIIIIIIDETSLWHVLKINSKEWPFIAVGAISSIGMAAVAPAFALLFGNVLEILSWEDLDAAREQSKVYSFMFIGLGLSSGLAMFLQGLLVKYYGKGRFKMVQKGSWKYFPLSRFYVWHIWGATNHEVASPRLFNHSQTGFLIGDDDEQ